MGETGLSWDDLATRFANLEPPLLTAFVYGQVQGQTERDRIEHWAVAGTTNLVEAQEFRELAKFAGSQLDAEQLQAIAPAARLDEYEPEARWYRALIHATHGGFKPTGEWKQRDQTGIFGSLPKPVSRSAALCRRLHVATNRTGARGLRQIAAEAWKTAALPLAITVAGTVIGGIILLRCQP